MIEWIQKQDPYKCCLQETHFRPRDTYRLKVRGWKKIVHANGNQKKAGVAIPISDKIDFKIKTITRDKEGNYIMIKGSIQEEDITLVNTYAPNIGGPQYIRQMLTAIKGEIDSNTIIERDFKTPLSREELQDGGGVRCGDHLPPHKYIKNTSTCGTSPTEHLLNAGRRPQTSQKARNSPCTWVGQKKKERQKNRDGTSTSGREL